MTSHNAPSNGFSDYCAALAARPFFLRSVSFPDVQDSFQKMAKRVTAIEIKGTSQDLDPEAMKRFEQTHRDFSPNGPVAKRIHAGFEFLEEVFPDRTPELSEQNFVLSLIGLAIQIASSCIGREMQKEFRDFAVQCFKQYDARSSIDSDTIEAEVRAIAFRCYAGTSARSHQTRQRILATHMAEASPVLAACL